MNILAKPPVKHHYFEVPSCAAERANALRSAASLGAHHGYIYLHPLCLLLLQKAANICCCGDFSAVFQHLDDVRATLFRDAQA